MMKVSIEKSDGYTRRWDKYNTDEIVIECDNVGLRITFDDEYQGGFIMVPFVVTFGKKAPYPIESKKGKNKK